MLDFFHPRVPVADFRVCFGQFIMAGIKEIFQHAEQIEVHEARMLFQNERQMREHHFERQQFFFELLEQILLVFAPLVNAAAAKFPFLEPQELQLFLRGNNFFPINIVEPERATFDVVFDIAPENGLHIAPAIGKQAKLEFIVEIFRDDLRIVIDFKNDFASVADDRHTVVALLRQFPDQRAVLIGNVRDFEWRARKFQNAALHDAERTPRKLDKFNHAEMFACRAQFTSENCVGYLRNIPGKPPPILAIIFCILPIFFIICCI